MPDDDELTAYYLESLVPTGAEHSALVTRVADALGLYLLDLMAGQGYQVVGGVTYEVPEPEVAPLPEGWCILRASVSVREFDAAV